MAFLRIAEDKRKILEWLFLDIENSLVVYLSVSIVYNYVKKIFGLNFIRRRDFEFFERIVVRFF